MQLHVVAKKACRQGAWLFGGSADHPFVQNYAFWFANLLNFEVLKRP